MNAVDHPHGGEWLSLGPVQARQGWAVAGWGSGAMLDSDSVWGLP